MVVATSDTDGLADQNLRWGNLWKIPQARLSSLIRWTYHTLPCPQNLHQWLKSEECCSNIFCKPKATKELAEEAEKGSVWRTTNPQQAPCHGSPVFGSWLMNLQLTHGHRRWFQLPEHLVEYGHVASLYVMKRLLSLLLLSRKRNIRELNSVEISFPLHVCHVWRKTGSVWKSMVVHICIFLCKI